LKGSPTGGGHPLPAVITSARIVAFGEYADDGTASTCKARDYKDATDLVVHPIDCRGVSPTLTSKMQGSSGWAPYNETEHLVPVAQPIPFDTTQISSRHNGSNPKEGDPCHPLAAGAHAPAIVVHGTQDPCTDDHVAFALGRNSGQENAVVLPVAYTTKLHNTSSNNAGKLFEERTPCLDANSPPPALLTPMAVRRLTPVECERLQGFPDNYTQIPWRNKPASECPDGPRYKALGNSWAVPNVRWIGYRIRLAAELAMDK